MKVIGLTGKNGGEMADLCDIEIRAPHSKYADRAQEIHIKIIHSLIDFIEKKITH
jgi:D-sedoheptulose 7-phosphate isomerase